MAEKLFLIDAMTFAFRAYFAIRSAMTDANGRPTNAVYGFTRVLLKVLREHEPSHVAVVFDAPGGSFRNELYPEYKANRDAAPEDLVEQFPRMYEVVRALNLPLFVVPGVEADDVIATLARQGEAAGMEVALVSGDKDLLQLVSETVRVFDPSKGDNGVWQGPEDVAERFGAGPEHVVDALALIGDSADNVPGVRGIGEKTAKKLLEKYGSLEGIYAHLDELKGKQREKITEDREQAFFSRELVTLRTDVDIGQSLEACLRTEFDRDAVMEIFSALRFRSMLDELLPGGDADREETPRDYTLVLTEEQLTAAIGEMRAAKVFAVDTETTSINAVRADLVGVSMSCSAGKAYYVPVAHAPEALTIFEDPDDLSTAKQLECVARERALELLRPLLEDPSVGKIGHNIKYDLIVLRRAGIDMDGIVMDTMLASYLTEPGRIRHNLDELSLEHFHRRLIPISELIGKGAKATTFNFVPVDRACEYACEDADMTWRLKEVFDGRLREQALEALLEDVEMPLLPVLARMEEAGVAIDVEHFAVLQRGIEAQLETLSARIFELAGESFNINSPKQLQVILFDKLGLPFIRKTKTGYSTDVDVLEELSLEHDVPGKILEYRSLEKLRGTYIEALPKMIHPETGRIHTSFNQAVAATGRLSSSNPNLQNIPIRTETGRRIREGFVPGGKNRRLISADYSQIELRIVAHLSADENLCAAFARDADVHKETAARVFHVPDGEVTPEMRRRAKAVNFGVIYGMSAFGLAKNLRIPRAEAARFIDDYFAQYPAVRAWLDATIEEARKRGYVTTLLKRRRYLPDLDSKNVNARRGAERIATNTPVQGSAADIIKLAMIRLDRALKERFGESGAVPRLLLQVHDELLLEAREEDAEDTAELTRRVMEEAVTLDVPLKVDVGIGRNWAEIH